MIIERGESMMKRLTGLIALMVVMLLAFSFAAAEEPQLPELPEGVAPVTWEVTPEHPMIDTDEARLLYEQIQEGVYPTMKELRENPVVAQLDALSAYYKALYGNTAEINTPERDALRQEKKEWFLTLGSARTESVDDYGRRRYVYDGPLQRDYQMELVLGLPASGKSTMIVDPDSEALGAFVLDPDVIKAALPEYVETHGAAADAIHFEGMKIFNDSLEAFLTGDMKGVNVILPIVGTDLNELMETYIHPFEAAGYRVKVKFREAKTNEAAARVVMRELGGGQLINSRVAFDFGAGVEDVYKELAVMINAQGEPYGFDVEPAAAFHLKQMVVLSRHNIRSPLSEKGSVVSDITPHEWFAWTSNAGELSLRGAMLETTMGQYFRLYLEKEGLFPENYIPKEDAVRFYANGFQRTQATAHYFSTGLLPVAVVPVERHEDYNQPDATFLPVINFMNEAYAEDVFDEIAERGGGEGLDGYRASLEEAYQLIRTITDMEESEAYRDGKYGDLETDESYVTLEAGDEPRIAGPMKYMNSVADALILQYYEVPDDLQAAFGYELTEDDWRTIGNVLATYEKILFTAPSLAANLAHPMLKEIYAELNTEGREFSFLCGHDSTITSFLAALGVEEYELPGAVETTTPIGTKVVFERWEDAEGKNWYTVNLVYQSARQMRNLTPLSLEVPPMIVPITFEGVPVNDTGMITEEDLMNLFRNKIGMLEELEETYSEEALEPAA